MENNQWLDAISTAENAEVVPKRSVPDIEAPSLDVFSKALRRDEIVVIFKNPDGGQDLPITLKALSPGERLDTQKSILSPQVISAMGTEKSDEELLEEIMKDPLAFRKADNDAYEIALDIVQRTIVEPINITLDILRGWDEIYIMRLVTALMEVARAKPTARFPDENNGTGEQGPGDSSV